MNDAVDCFLAQCMPEPNSGCWLWLGALDTDDYGRFYFAGQEFKAHRASHVLFKGPIPAIENAKRHGTCVLHTCDVRPCVNPDHLYAGTQADNIRDAVARDRHGHPLLGKNHNAKLTPQDIPRIRRLYEDGCSYRDIGKRFGVNHKSIKHVIDGKSWGHVA
jgi:hypothetical protein